MECNLGVRFMQEKELVNYLTEGFEKNKINEKTFKIADSQCPIEFFNDFFGTNITCNQFNQVVNGEGDETRKIKTIFSSSLQSLIIFSGVSKNNPIYINETWYTDVFFEYRNKVIGAPSSMDVVLTNKNNDILFIESKLSEIISASTEKTGCYVVRKSYFSPKKQGFHNVLGLKDNDLRIVGVDQKDVDKDGKAKINPIEDQRFVYSEGIKQLLAHTIGIKHFLDKDYYVLSPILVSKPSKVSFATIYNELPNYDLDEAQEKLMQFKNHEEKVTNLLKEKNCLKKITFLHLSYQELYKNNVDYFDKHNPSGKIAKFYKLKHCNDIK